MLCWCHVTEHYTRTITTTTATDSTSITTTSATSTTTATTTTTTTTTTTVTTTTTTTTTLFNIYNTTLTSTITTITTVMTTTTTATATATTTTTPTTTTTTATTTTTKQQLQHYNTRSLITTKPNQMSIVERHEWLKARQSCRRRLTTLLDHWSSRRHGRSKDLEPIIGTHVAATTCSICPWRGGRASAAPIKMSH